MEALEEDFILNPSAIGGIFPQNICPIYHCPCRRWPIGPILYFSDIRIWVYLDDIETFMRVVVVMLAS